jgi:hypothetical protein
LSVLGNIRAVAFFLLGTTVPFALAQGTQPPKVTKIEVKDPGGQILSYRYLSGSTEVRLRGTHRAPDARVRLKIGSRPGFVELDINRGAISGLKPARQLGKDFLTYVLWAVSVDGKAANLGEITFDGSNPVSINVTTPYQTFWLMVTAEPDYAVSEPSSQIVLYSVSQNAADGAQETRAQTIARPLFYYTHYTGYDASPGVEESGPNELLQARKAVELASRSGILAERGRVHSAVQEEQQTLDALALAKAFLIQAEDAYRTNPKGSNVVQFSRTAAQIAENARAVAAGAVGDMLIRRLEAQVRALQSEVAALKADRRKPPEESDPESAVITTSVDSPVLVPDPVPNSPAEEPLTEVRHDGIIKTMIQLASQPITWFGVIGWIFVILLLFRKRTA